MQYELQGLLEQLADQLELGQEQEELAVLDPGSDQMTTSVVNNSVFRGFFEKQKLTGPNFIDWYRQLRIVLSVEDKLDYLEQPIPPAPVPAQAGQQVAPEALAAHAAWVKGSKEIKLKTLFAQQAEQEILQTVRDFHSCKQEEGQSVSSYVLKMKSYIDNLERLGHPVSLNLGVSLILISLRKEFDSFVQNYNMHGMGKTVNELHAMLKLHEQTLTKKDPALHAIWAGKGLRGSRKLKPGALSLYVGNARKPYTHQVERAKDLLELKHTDVCGPFKTVSRQGASYFVTFTDDFSRYGYVYLLKHKHEVFETFKVFQKEVENQLEKTIKSLPSDRGGEYMSQEILDHLKEHGIIAHRTPPYTPQHNGVPEKRNRTLLDIVRSMISQTTFPKSFWDYTFETVACIRNMVPSKKVKKTPYEVWHGQPPKLSYLKSRVVRSTRAQHAPDHICLYIDAEEHDLGDLGKPANYKAALLDPESKKWLDAMNVEMQFMKNKEVWDLIDLPPNGKTVGSKWLFKKKNDMDGAVHTFKAHIRVIRILKAIAAYYDYRFGKWIPKLPSSMDISHKMSIWSNLKVLSIHNIQTRLGVVLTIKEPININYENTGAITIANESGITKGARHFRAKVHYLREVIEYGDIKLEKVHICPFTKALAFPKHSEHTKNIRMLPASSLM
ncbi:retrotransposon protein, putative, ty1-copia subclass [Tanacetum coccineum]